MIQPETEEEDDDDDEEYMNIEGPALGVPNSLDEVRAQKALLQKRMGKCERRIKRTWAGPAYGPIRKRVDWLVWWRVAVCIWIRWLQCHICGKGQKPVWQRKVTTVALCVAGTADGDSILPCHTEKMIKRDRFSLFIWKAGPA